MDLLKDVLGIGQNIGNFFKKKASDFVDFITPDKIVSPLPTKQAPPPKQSFQLSLPKFNFSMPKIGGIDIGKTIAYYTGNAPKDPRIERINRESIFNPANMQKSYANAQKQAGANDLLSTVIFHGKQQAAQLPQTFPQYVRTTSERAFGPQLGRIIAAPTANTGQALTQGAYDVYKGTGKLLSVPELIKRAKYGEAAGTTLEGGAKILFGGAKGIAAQTPLFQLFNTVSGMDNLPGRFSRGIVRGMTGENLDPNAPKKLTKIGPLEVDLADTAGQMIGFVKNPAWQKIFPVTSQILKVNPTANKVANFLFQRATKGGLEGYIQALAQMPDKPTEEQKWQLIRDNVLLGVGSEVGFDLFAKGASALANKKLAVRLMDTISNEWRRANIPVYDSVRNKRMPMWQYRLRDQSGAIDPNAKIENPLTGREPLPGPHTPLDVEALIKKTKQAITGEQPTIPKPDQTSPPLSPTARSIGGGDLPLGPAKPLNELLDKLATGTMAKQDMEQLLSMPEIKAAYDQLTTSKVGGAMKDRIIAAIDSGDYRGVLTTLQPYLQGDLKAQLHKAILSADGTPAGAATAETITKRGARTAEEIVADVQNGTFQKRGAGDITPPNEPPAPPTRGFVETVKNSPNTEPEVAAGVKGTYDPITNADTMKRAQETVKNNYDEAVRMVNREGPLTADDSAVAQQLISRAQREGRMEDAIGIVEKIAERATTAGQGIQALSMWNKLGPDGVLLYTKKLFEKAGKQQGILDKALRQKKPELTPELAKTLTDMASDIQTMKDPTAKMNATKAMLQLISDQIPMKVSNVIDEFRYNNILSSPRTHFVNTFSNFIQAAVLNPLTKGTEGGLDFMRATLTNDKQRRVFASEVPVYYRGMISSFGDATKDFLDAVQGVKNIERPDLNVKELDALVQPESKLPGALKMPSRVLEGADRFWMRLLKGGEEASLNFRKGKGVDVGDIAAEAEKRAKYFTFRQPVDASGAKTGQGHVLRGVDQMTKAIYQMRKVPGVKWFIPFVQTPMNITKQMIEYSPMGITTLAGAANKQEQLAKTLIGTTAMSAAAWLVSNFETTWAAPTGKKEKELFYASGRQPYSIKIGDNWVQINQLGPLSIAFVVPMAFKQAFGGDNNPTDGQLKNMGQVVTGVGKFLTDQTYVKGLGDLVKALQGDEVAFGQTLTNVPRQLIPMSSLLGWAARMIDPISRNPGKDVAANIAAGLPFLSKMVEPFRDPTGEPSQIPHPILNSFSPIRIGEVRDFFEPFYQRYKEGQAQDREKRALKAERDRMLGNGEGGGFLIGANGKIAGANTEISGDLMKYAKMYEFDKYLGQGSATGIEKFKQDNEKLDIARKIFEGEGDYQGIPDEIKSQAYKAMGLDEKKVQYDYMANQKDDIKSQFIISQLEGSGMDHKGLMTVLQAGRVQSYSNKMIVSDGVLDDLYEAGYISYNERKEIKKLKLTAEGEQTRGSARATGGGGGSAKKGKAFTMDAPPKISTLVQNTKNQSAGQLKVPEIDVDTEIKNVKLPSNKPPTVQQILAATKAKATPQNIAKARAIVESAKEKGGTASKPPKLARSSYRGGVRRA